MDDLGFVKNYLEQSIDTKIKILGNENLLLKIASVSKLIVDCYRAGGKVLLAGNGGSAGDAQHIAAEFVSRFYYDRPGLPAISLTTDSSMLTAIGNDYGFDRIFSRQVQAQGGKGDVFIGISTSGNSLNVTKAIEEAASMGITTVGLCGEGGKIKSMVDYPICIPSSSTPLIQESHICVGHMICAIVEKTIYPQDINV